MKRFGSLLRGAAALCLSGCAAFESPVARTVNGVTTEGRFIEPDAYALYALGALREARGEWRAALGFYERAREIDDRGPEIATRIGAVACRLRDIQLSNQAFTRAERADASYGPLWFELARCRQLRGELEAAHAAALEAVRLDPERDEASLLAADIAEARGDAAAAFRLRDALATRAPDSVVVHRNLLESARRARDDARVQRASEALQRLAARTQTRPTRQGVAQALRALELGDLETAKSEASVLLQADPSNGDALVVALAVADLMQDQHAFDQLLDGAARPGRAASEEVLTTLAALLSRRVGAEAAASIQAR